MRKPLSSAGSGSFFEKTFGCCGEINPEVKDLGIRRWRCPACGAEHDRDVNAARNILEKGLEMLAS